MQVIPAAKRFHTDLGWLDSHHVFAFGQHYDPTRVGFGPVRVINDDIVAPGRGFGAHPHRDMEIVSVVLDGALAHESSDGSTGVVSAGEVQFMRAGTGVAHAEMNASHDAPVHFLQLWLEPRTRGLAPAYHQFRPDMCAGAWTTLGVSADPAIQPSGQTPEGLFAIDQDVRLSLGHAAAGKALARHVAPGRAALLYVIAGQGQGNETPIAQGDTLVASEAGRYLLQGDGLQVLDFDLAADAA